MITGVLLAAGSSSRMGDKNKLLLSYGDQTIIETVFSNMQNSDLDNLIVVTGFEADRIKMTLGKKINQQVEIIINKSYSEGRASSIKAALSNINKQCEALLFMVADKPTITTTLINRAIKQFKSETPDILAVKTPNGRGHPVIYNKRMFTELDNLKGDQVGQNLFEKYADRVSWLTDTNSQPNINTIDDYKKLLLTMSVKKQ